MSGNIPEKLYLLRLHHMNEKEKNRLECCGICAGNVPDFAMTQQVLNTLVFAIS